MHIRYNINFKSQIGNINNLYLVIFYIPTYQHIHSHSMQVWKEIHQNIGSLSVQNGAIIWFTFYFYKFVLFKIHKRACIIT